MNTATLYNEKKKTIGPKLRFQEFNNEWTKIKLGDLLTFKNGLNSDKEKYGKGIKFINVLDILNNNFITYDKILGSVEVTEKEFEKNEVSYGDVLFQRSSETRAEVGQANVYLDRDKSSVFGGFVIRGKAKYEYNPLFMNYLLRTPIARKEITDKSGGSTRYNVGQDTLSQVQLTTTTISEQKKIASFLSVVDEKIQQLSRKKELLEQYKKGVMQQLFSGKLRFKDENGEDYPDWEEKKLGEVCESIKSGKSNSSEQGRFPLYGSTGIIGKCIEYSHEGLFILIARVGANAGMINLIEDRFGVSDNTLVLNCNQSSYTDYLFHYLGYFNLNRLVFGSGQPLITGSQLKSLKLNLPSFLEQQKIANFLSSIHDKIESTNKQITQTQTFKKGLLQQMFV